MNQRRPMLEYNRSWSPKRQPLWVYPSIFYSDGQWSPRATMACCSTRLQALTKISPCSTEHGFYKTQEMPCSISTCQILLCCKRSVKHRKMYLIISFACTPVYFVARKHQIRLHTSAVVVNLLWHIAVLLNHNWAQNILSVSSEAVPWTGPCMKHTQSS